MKVKTSELSGAALDYFVYVAITGAKASEKNAFAWRYQNDNRKDYSTNWLHGGSLIDRYCPHFTYYKMDERVHALFPGGQAFGETYLESICRAVVAYKLGDEVEVPDQLVDACAT